MAVLDELSSAATQVVAQVGPAVVRIGRGGGRGCGVVLSDGPTAPLIGLAVLPEVPMYHW